MLRKQQLLNIINTVFNGNSVCDKISLIRYTKEYTLSKMPMLLYVRNDAHQAAAPTYSRCTVKNNRE